MTNRKPAHRKGQVQLSDATQWFKPLRRNMGKKNCELAADDIQRICHAFLAFKETPQSKIFPNAAFGYWKVKVERPLRLHSQLTRQGPARRLARPVRTPLYLWERGRGEGAPRLVEFEPDSELRDFEQIPMLEPGGIEAFIRREVLPYTSDAWLVEADTKIGYEVSFTRHFYQPPKLRTLAEISADILAQEQETEGLLHEITKGVTA